MTQEALKLALDALENHTAIKHPQQIHYRDKAITAIKEALAQTQEPVAHWSDCAVHNEPAYPKGECDCGGIVAVADYTALSDKYVALSDKYVALKAQLTEQEPWCMKMNGCKTKCEDCPDEPPQRTWVGLTEDERDHLAGLHLYAVKGQVEAWIEGVDDFAQAIEAKLKEKNHAT
jgi:hypothetical protein